MRSNVPAHPFHLRAPPSPPRANGCSPMPPPPLPGAPNAPPALPLPPPPPLADTESGAAAAWASGEEWLEAEEEDLEATACRSGFRLCAANARGLPLPPPAPAPAASAAAPGALLLLLLVLFAPAPSPADDREGGDVEKGILAGSVRGLEWSLLRPPVWMCM